ncbi:MAG: polysaccharide pyruvyl transferase family protein, partial [Nevskiaceae bacterium]
MTASFVTLTGSKRNAGDHLIRHRAHALLRWLRPDREIVDVDGWRPLADADLEKINGARALILCGGPALQRRMVPKIYNLPALDRIRVPVVSLGIGWKSRNGAWRDTAEYPFDPRSAELLERMDRSGLGSSVRDYHSLVMLERRGLRNFVNTGCPALYERTTLEPALPAGPAPFTDPGSIGFSLGVAHRESRSMAEQSRALLLALRARYPRAALTVAFHHPPADWPGDARFARWLE